MDRLVRARVLEAGYVQQRRAVRDTRQRVWLKFTNEGRAAYRAHVASLREIIGQADEDQAAVT